ncbi:hypothetical protein [Alienimonas chondri]|uniref:Alpha/beta hydrolase n=1 Tax=Alienimonas chondri TaxID=2681879 RepID=A0ABX1VF08_9PLAN|nr:hypothetical protein [Alienimonas chondri]NNJ25853.1 hypothetical protein [Alienimonas chondri]
MEGRAQRLNDPAFQQAGLTLILPGIQSRSFAEADLALGLADGGLTGRIEVLDWTTGWFFRAVRHLWDVEMHEAGGAEAARRIVDHRERFPAAPVSIVGYSGGASVALHALRRLPAGVTATRTVLLSPACSPTVDAAALEVRCDEGIDSFCSRLDWPILVLLMTALGTTDRLRRPAAGWAGFERTDPADDRFREYRWRPAWVRDFHYGGHFGAVNRVFAAERLAPLLMERQRGGTSAA